MVTLPKEIQLSFERYACVHLYINPRIPAVLSNVDVPLVLPIEETSTLRQQLLKIN